MKKLILSVMMFAMAGTMNLFAQSQEYIDAFNKLFDTFPSMINQLSKESMKSTLLDISDQLGIENNKEAIVDKYLETQFMTDVKDVCLGLYHENVTLEELNSIAEEYKNQDLLDAYAKMQEASKNMDTYMQGYLISNIMQIMSGNEPVPLEIEEDVTEEYFDLVKQYTKVSNTVSLIDNSKNSIIGAITNQIDNEEQKKEFTTLMNKLFDMVTSQYDIMFANSSKSFLTKKDIQILTQYEETEAGKAQNRAVGSLTNDIINTGKKIINKFSEWYNSQK